MAKSEAKFSLSMEQRAMLDDALKAAEPTKFIETGDVGLDLALTDGKGLPMGASVLFWAKHGSGKTTVLVDACKRLIQSAKNRGEVFRVLYLAVENSRSLISSMGMDEYIDSGDFIYYGKSLKWRQVESFYAAVLNEYKNLKGVKLIVIDSVNNVQSDQNMKNSVADGDYGTKARERYAFYQKFLPLCKEQGISSFFIAQQRQKQNASQFEDHNKAAVGDGDLHNVDIIIKCTSSQDKADASKIKEETVFGTDEVASKCIFKMDSKATNCKNRYIRGNKVEVLFEKGKCVWNYYAVKKLLIGNKLIKVPSAGWYTFDSEICTSFGIPDGKLRNAEVNRIVQDHISDFVELLKKMDRYKVGLKETEIVIDDDSEVETVEEEEE